MAERGTLHRSLMRALYAVLAVLLVFLHLLPVDMLPPGWVGPDLLVALTFAWAVRRPDYVPLLLVATIVLATDLLFQRPPGLWAALVVLGCAALRDRAHALRDPSFVSEWLAVASTLVAITLGYRLVLTVFLVDQAPLGLSAMQLLSTVLAYPLVALVSHVVLGVRKAAPGDLAATRRLA